ncbi:MAG: DNA primase [Clostridia bacterium]|nr:DNA primase [Clostridia bacterium]
MIDRQVVDEILARTDMHSLVSSYVSLKRAGANYSGLCPFHSERTPSFTVFPSDGSFYCFGCGVGGNAITFVRRIENLEFSEAVASLARRAGITLRLEEDRTGPKYDRKRFYEMNKTAAQFFNKSLFAENADAKAALGYFTENRQLSLATVKRFGLGYAPNNYSFVDYMRKQGYTEDELITGFLCGRSEKGGLYPSFRNRVMFPIIDVSGNVIAFGGRVMDDSLPKYKNSSDTPVFRKGNNLFALNFAHKECAERIILCEGYMDVIALHAAGFSYAVATLGTAIRPEQARLMSRYTKQVIISYDSDEAGQKAADKALRILEEVGLEVRVLRIPNAKDPDEYIRKNGADAFKRVLDDSSTKFDFNFNKITAKYDVNIPQQKIEAVNELCRIISEVYSSVEREVYIREGAKRLGVDPRNMEKDVAQKLAVKRKEGAKKELQSARQNLSGYGDAVNPDYVKMPRVARFEEAVLGLLQLYPAFRSRAFGETPLLTEDDFPTAFGKRVFGFIRDAEEAGGFATELLDSAFSTDEVGRLAGMRVARMQLTDNGDRVFDECVNALKQAVNAEKRKDAPVTVASLDDLLKRKRNDN